MAKELKVIIADDHSVVREGLTSILDFADGITVVGEASDGKEAVQLARELKPDVVIMDLMMPVLNGTEATEQIVAENSKVRILVLTTYGSVDDIRKVLANGATSAIMKTATKQSLVSAIRSTAVGKRVISPDIETTLATAREKNELTERQLEILQSVTRGLTNREIAMQYGISQSGVKHHLIAIFQKIGAATRSEAVAIALRKHLLKM